MSNPPEVQTLSLTEDEAQAAHSALTLLCPESPLLTLLQSAFPDLSPPTKATRGEALRTISSLTPDTPTPPEVSNLEEFLALTQPRCDLYISHFLQVLGDPHTSVDIIALLYGALTLATSAAILGEIHPHIQAHIVRSVWTLITNLPDIAPHRAVELIQKFSESEPLFDATTTFIH